MASSDREGWHVHLSLFGFELTLWEPWTDAVPDTDDELPKRAEREHSKIAEDGRPVLLADGAVTAGWVSLFWIDPGPLPMRVAIPDIDPAALLGRSMDERAGILADAPPAPPPEMV